MAPGKRRRSTTPDSPTKRIKLESYEPRGSTSTASPFKKAPPSPKKQSPSKKSKAPAIQSKPIESFFQITSPRKGGQWDIDLELLNCRYWCTIYFIRVICIHYTAQIKEGGWYFIVRASFPPCGDIWATKRSDRGPRAMASYENAAKKSRAIQTDVIKASTS